MSAASVQCPLCFTRSPAPPDGAEVVCPSCTHAFAPASASPPPRKNPDVPLARALPVGGSPKSEPKPATPPRARRVSEGDEDDRPRTRTRSRRRNDDEPVKRGGSALPGVLIAGGVLAAITLGGLVVLTTVLLVTPAASTAPVAVAGPVLATAFDDDIAVEAEPTPFEMREEIDPALLDLRPHKQPKVEEHGEKADPNTNALVTMHQAKLVVTASSHQAHWPPALLTDDKPDTAWHSSLSDSTFNNSKPWVKVTFPDDVSVKRVTILGNRDPTYGNGFIVREGELELLDANGKVISSHELSGEGDGKELDFDLRLAKPAAVRAIRFTMTKSLGGNCGLGEFQVE